MPHRCLEKIGISIPHHYQPVAFYESLMFIVHSGGRKDAWQTGRPPSCPLISRDYRGYLVPVEFSGLFQGWLEEQGRLMTFAVITPGRCAARTQEIPN